MTPRLEARMRAFEQGAVGASVRRLDLRERTALGLHEVLVGLGFDGKPSPLRAPGGGYLRLDGSRATDPEDPEVLREGVYTHADGGMVRVRPDGVPGDLRRPWPHASKSVLYDATRPPTRDNEAFLVTSDGLPVPRSAHRSDGMTQLADVEANEERLDLVMREAYAPLIGET
jgi:hypothetical protein